MDTYTYYVLGLMSGTSLDGVDLALCEFTYKEDNWIYNILNADTFKYSNKWIESLQDAENATGRQLVELDHAYGTYLGELVLNFTKQQLVQPDFVASHGHTIFHQPAQHISLQLGNGAYLAANARLPVICDFRTLDIALGGQGAPLVPIGDELLFAGYDFCINLGGISNVSYTLNGQRYAFDISACNMLLNTLANSIGLSYDAGGELARTGELLPDLFALLQAPLYFAQAPPKSLGKEWVLENSLASIAGSPGTVADKLHTVCHHIAIQIKQALPKLHPAQQRVLLTGGGAFNLYLVELIRQYLGDAYHVEVPAPKVVDFKEALIFAFLGVLRWRGTPNCLRSVTGAAHNNCGGAIYMP